jgi:uncharacterized protein (DUF885 family)
MRIGRVALGLWAVWGAACGGAARSGQSEAKVAPDRAADGRPAGAAAWDALVDEYIEGAFKRDPAFAVSQGRHDFDGRVADLSREGIARDVRELSELLRRAQALPADSLDPERRFERDYLMANAEGSLFWLVKVKEQSRNPLFYSSAIDPSVYVTRDYAPLDQRLRATVHQLDAVPRVVAAMRENLVSPLSRTHLQVSSEVYAGLISYLEKDVPQLFAASSDTALKSELQTTTTRAVASLREFLAYLEAERPKATEAFALGPELFQEMLWATERVDTPVAELASLGQQDLERNLDALKSACGELSPGRSLADCVGIVNADKPAEGPVALARVQLVQLRQFVASRGLVSIPGTEEARVEEAPPHKRWNQAFIDIPGPYDIGQPSIYYIAPPDPKWTEAERLAYIPGAADLLFISVHEVWPGHFLQFLHANRASRMFGRLFVGYAFAEGWAHYSEELMWEAGFSGDPKVHVGQLLNALLRNVRFVSAIGLHTQGMTVAESERLFLEQALQDPANAKQQAARGTFDPGYLNYTLGKLIIRKLRDDWTGPRGGQSAYLTFHDTLLSFGGPPLPLVRNAMLGEPSSPL